MAVNGIVGANYMISQLGRSYEEMVCIRAAVVNVIRNCPGGDPGYRCGGCTELWNSLDSSPRYKFITERLTIQDAKRSGLLVGDLPAIYNNNTGICEHIAYYVGDHTVNGEVFDVIHSSYTRGKVCWTKLGNGFTHVLRHKLIRGVPASSGNTGGNSSGNQGGNEIVNILYTATVATAGGALNLRSAAAVRRGNVIAQIPFGETVSVVQENGEWSKVVYGNATGYVSAQYLKKAGSGNSGTSSDGASVPGDGGYGVFIRCNSLAEAQAMAAALAACSVSGSND